MEELKNFRAAVRPTRTQAAFVISSCLQATPKDWWDLVKEESDNFTQFVIKFKRRYWGEETQHSVKAKLEFGSYQTGREGPITAYAIKIFREAKGLTPTLSVKAVISKLARHFNEEIRSTILGRPINTLEDLLELLDRFDNTGSLNSHKTGKPDTRESWRSRTPTNQQQQTRYTGPNQYRRTPELQNTTSREETWRRPNRNQASVQNNIRYEDPLSRHQCPVISITM